MPVYNPDGTNRIPRLPRLGIIRLGIKKEGERKDGSKFTYPVASDHFELHDAPEVAEIFGTGATVLEPVIIPGEDEEIVAAHYLRMYSATWGLTCMGDGRGATRLVDTKLLGQTGEIPTNGIPPADRETMQQKHPTQRVTVPCPCPFLEEGVCKETMYLRFMLPTVPGLGVWQLSTGSANSIKNIQGTFALLRGLAGRISGIPLSLSLVKQEVTRPGGGRNTVHVLQLNISGGLGVTAVLDMARVLAPAALMPPLDLATFAEDGGEPEDTGVDADKPLEVVPPEAEEAEYTTKADAADIQAAEAGAAPVQAPEQAGAAEMAENVATSAGLEKAKRKLRLPQAACEIHDVQRMGMSADGTQRCHKLPDEEFCYGVVTPSPSPAAVIVENATIDTRPAAPPVAAEQVPAGGAEPPVPATVAWRPLGEWEMGDLHDYLAAENTDWREFQREVLKMSWVDWGKLGGTMAEAVARHEAWKQLVTSADADPAAVTNGGMTPQLQQEIDDMYPQGHVAERVERVPAGPADVASEDASAEGPPALFDHRDGAQEPDPDLPF